MQDCLVGRCDEKIEGEPCGYARSSCVFQWVLFRSWPSRKSLLISLIFFIVKTRHFFTVISSSHFELCCFLSLSPTPSLSHHRFFVIMIDYKCVGSVPGVSPTRTAGVMYAFFIQKLVIRILCSYGLFYFMENSFGLPPIDYCSLIIDFSIYTLIVGMVENNCYSQSSDCFNFFLHHKLKNEELLTMLSN